jgi:hypothetical protein
MVYFKFNDTKSLAKIYRNESELYVLDIKNAYSPFGIDEYDKSATLKCSIKDDYNHDFIKSTIDNIESEFKKFLNKNDITINNCRKTYYKKGNFPTLFSLNIPKNRGLHLTKFYDEDGVEITANDFTKRANFHATIEIPCYSLYKDTWFLSLKVKRILLRSS